MIPCRTRRSVGGINKSLRQRLVLWRQLLRQLRSRRLDLGDQHLHREERSARL